jgi:predicted neutral ceramidase superfamily lipid hydrolase
MKLKTATAMVIVCLIIWLVISLLQWSALAFNLLRFSDYMWLFRGIGLAQTLLHSIPLIVFFIVLSSKQRGE